MFGVRHTWGETPPGQPPGPAGETPALRRASLLTPVKFGVKYQRAEGAIAPAPFVHFTAAPRACAAMEERIGCSPTLDFP